MTIYRHLYWYKLACNSMVPLLKESEYDNVQESIKL